MPSGEQTTEGPWFVIYEIHRGATHLMWASRWTKFNKEKLRIGQSVEGSECFMLILGPYPWLDKAND